ncbi:MAG: Dol-P-Glc:Glc(2)Man(9)GlcNAc(2)-PP-Dol alpha-1,2-glucosyltransferase [Flavobacteriales bacterium]|jgi:hypothetical protein|nr:Dol-P-Glc:Glc(2)Man(9)GlcNAc(2)-PP-Dol alpha-1,2-glucosyltransferase [Flavobacteriales bacterium]
MNANSLINNKNIWFYFLAILLIGNALIYYFFEPLNVDEVWHHAQIKRYFTGDFSHEPMLTNIPGLHISVYAIAQTLGLENTVAWRIISGLIGFVGLFFGFKFLKFLNTKEPLYRIGQYFFLPWLFSFIFLLYIEWYGVAFMVSGIHFTYKKQAWLAGLFFLILLLGKQNFIPWVFMAAIIYWIEFVNKKDYKSYFQLLPYALIGILFLVFVKWNDGISMEAKRLHTLSIEHENIIMALFLLGSLYVPLIKRQKIKKIFQNNTSKWIYFMGIFLIIFGILFFDSKHYFNSKKIACLHNNVANYLEDFWWFKAFAFVIISIGWTVIMSTSFKKKSMYLLYPISALTLIPVTLIEFRYSIPFLILFNIFREETDKKSEQRIFWLFVLQALAIFAIFSTGRFP